MDTAVDGVGEMVTGLAVARVVEPTAGEPHDGDHGATCLNCKTSLVGTFCHACGQSGHVHRSLAAFGHDILHGVFHFEGKFFRTVPMLVWKPGELTRRYIDGERANFVSPIALFLFSVFLMFAAISWIGAPFNTHGGQKATPGEERAEAEADYKSEMAEATAKLNELDRELAQARTAGQPTDGIEEEISGVRLGMRLRTEGYQLQKRLTNQEEARENAPPEPASSRGSATSAADTVQIDDAPTGLAWLNKAFEKGRKNPSLLLYKLQSNAYKFSWALIPISVPFVWMLFLHRRRYRRQFSAYDHVIFVTYSIAFMSLGFVVLSLLRPLNLGGGVVGTAMFLVPPIHMYKQLRGAYGLSRFSALWRTFMLVNFAFVAGSIFFSLLLLLGVLG